MSELIVLWRVTTHCNLACGFCAYDRRLALPRQDADMGEALRFAAILAACVRQTGRQVLLSWIGGEPLLWKPLWAVCNELERHPGMAMSATTNGSTLHRASERLRVLEHFDEVTVSVDDFASGHEAMRGNAGGWTRLRDAVKALHRDRVLAGRTIRLRANVVLMRQNLASFDALCDELADWGVDEISFNALGGRDRPEFFEGRGLRLEDLAVLGDQLPAMRARLSARLVRLCGSQAYLERLGANADGHKLVIDDCAPGRSFLFIDEHGSISPCSFSSDTYGIPLSSIRNVDDLLALPQRYTDARQRLRATACNDCRANHLYGKFEV
jgi:MoaA/NifB/PqqE/SkfB family radical SAM enzyme